MPRKYIPPNISTPVSWKYVHNRWNMHNSVFSTGNHQIEQTSSLLDFHPALSYPPKVSTAPEIIPTEVTSNRCGERCPLPWACCLAFDNHDNYYCLQLITNTGGALSRWQRRIKTARASIAQQCQSRNVQPEELQHRYGRGCTKTQRRARCQITRRQLRSSEDILGVQTVTVHALG